MFIIIQGLISSSLTLITDLSDISKDHYRKHVTTHMAQLKLSSATG